jgi:DNA-3-methyladenine glycosylase II
MPRATAAAVPDYWDDACRHLGKRDRVMRKLIPKFGEARLQSRGDAFTTLARSIVGQQISVKAAQSVWGKFVEAIGGPSTRVEPAAVLEVDATSLRGSGLSARKCEYLVDLAHHFEDGRVHPKQWQVMEDEAIIEELVAIRHRPLDGRDVPYLPPAAARRAAARRPGPHQGHQRQLLQRRAGFSCRSA